MPARRGGSRNHHSGERCAIALHLAARHSDGSAQTGSLLDTSMRGGIGARGQPLGSLAAHPRTRGHASVAVTKLHLPRDGRSFRQVSQPRHLDRVDPVELEVAFVGNRELFARPEEVRFEEGPFLAVYTSFCRLGCNGEENFGAC
jgi:hypothetical protein